MSDETSWASKIYRYARIIQTIVCAGQTMEIHSDTIHMNIHICVGAFVWSFIHIEYY